MKNLFIKALLLLTIGLISPGLNYAANATQSRASVVCTLASGETTELLGIAAQYTELDQVELMEMYDEGKVEIISQNGVHTVSFKDDGGFALIEIIEAG